jgi:SAM-dependent methyltransferase
MNTAKTESSRNDWDRIHAGKIIPGRRVSRLANPIHPTSEKETRIWQIASGGSIAEALEAGCGTGKNVLRIAPLVKLSAGIDFSEEAISRAAQRRTAIGLGSNTAFYLADIRAMPFGDDTFDFVYSFGVIEHFKDPLPLLREMRRVLKPDGIFLLGVPNSGGFGRTRRWMEIARKQFGYHDFYTCNELATVTDRAGFKLKKTYHLDFAWAVKRWYESYVVRVYLPNQGVWRYINASVGLTLYWLSYLLKGLVKHKGFHSVVEATK